MGQMRRASTERKPAFFWQAGLILLPVLLLAVVGAQALRTDSRIARTQASERAQAIADALVQKLSEPLSAPSDPQAPGILSFKVGRKGELLTPPPLRTPGAAAALDLNSLTSEQRQAWSQAQREETLEQRPDHAVELYRSFLQGQPPVAFRALAAYSSGLLLMKKGDYPAAEELFQTVVTDYPTATTESGIPLSMLGSLKLLETNIRRRTAAPEVEQTITTLCSNAVWQPSALSGGILDHVAQLAEANSSSSPEQYASWKKLWERHQYERQLYYAWTDSRLQLAEVPRVAWFKTAEALPRAVALGLPGSRYLNEVSVGDVDQTWLAQSQTEGSNTWIVCRPERQIGAVLTERVEASPYLPDIFGVGLTVAGKRLLWPAPDIRLWTNDWHMSRSGGQKGRTRSPQPATDVLATSESASVDPRLSRNPDEPPLLHVAIYLTDPAGLFAREQKRARVFIALIACAALAATVGCAAAYRAFHRQLHLSELKSNFVSSVSHELRAPIASVRLMAESLERGKITEEPKQREYFKFIVQECRRLSSLIENVLDFSRIEQGRKEYEFEPTDVLGLAQQTVKVMEPYAEERQVKLLFEQSANGSTELSAVLDGKAIQQALVNLIDNAIKHSRKGDTVTVGLGHGTSRLGPPEGNSASSVDAPPVALRRDGDSFPVINLSVEDHGEGIPASEHQKIFERFYRLGSELRRETQGVGIGLSIVKHVVEAHGGRVVVRSAPGAGSRFTIELPVQQSSSHV